MERFLAVFADLPHRPSVWLVICQANLYDRFVGCVFISGCASLGLFDLICCVMEF